MARIIQTADLTLQAVSRMSKNDLEWTYNGLDCCVTLEILHKLLPQLDATSQHTYDFSRSMQAPIMEMSLRGLRIDWERHERVLKEFKEKRERIGGQLDRIIFEGVGVECSWSSPKQLMNLFYDVLALPTIRKRNANGQMVPTINREAIEKLSQHFYAEPLCNHLLALRDLSKKIQFLETEVDADGYMRCSFNIAGTKTGRLASSMSEFGTGTNLQNVDRDLRSVFISEPGWKYANLDLEQADARNVGAIIWQLFYESHGAKAAGAYLDACESGDLHTVVCSMAWSNLDWPGDPKGDRALADQIAYRNLSYRDLAKRLGHGTNYLGTPPTMAKHTKVQKQLIEFFQERYFSAFPLIGSPYMRSNEPNWHNWVKEQLWSEGQITSLLNRRRYFFGRAGDDKMLREAVAHEPQSLTGDQINLGLRNIWRANRVAVHLQVHDSILIQYREEDENEIIPWALDALKTKIILKGDREFVVPTEAKIGWNWGDKTDDNPDGLIKWKGRDDRQRTRLPETRKKLSVRSLL